MEKIGFVILHYHTIDDTRKCVKSIFDNIDNSNFEIVIVDNASSNGTGKVLAEEFKNEKKIHVILNKENLGFSKGNNIGYRYAKENLNCDYIVMLNNDTYLIQKDFFKQIQKEYEYSEFGVLGPQIHLPNGKICRFSSKLRNLKQIRIYNLKIYIKLILNYMGLENLFTKAKVINKEKEQYTQGNERVENVVLHGCCWIFSPKFVDKIDGIDEFTFLYNEEDFLYIKTYRNNMITVYNPKIKIFHNESSSTRETNKNSKNRFRYKNLLKANKILEKQIKSFNLNK